MNLACIQDFPAAATRQSTMAPASNLNEDLDSRLLRRFASIHRPAQGQDSNLALWDGRGAVRQ
jgi:hypothetical protein